MAAFLISSKHAIKPKVRLWAFSFYIAVCICFGSMGILTGIWGLVVNQTVLFFINCRGIYNAVKELSGEKEDSARHIQPHSNLSGVKPAGNQSENSKPLSKRDPFEVIVPPNFWRDILEEDDWDDILGENESLEHDY